MNKNLIYLCVFYNRDYIQLLELLIQSLYINSNIDNNNTDILIITSNDFYIEINEIIKKFELNVNYFLLEINNVFDAGCARLNIFDYEKINNYNKILYLDTDILINSNINNLFSLDTDSNKIYALEEGFIHHDFWGGQFFDFNNIDKNTKAFCSGILYFKNNVIIKTLFEDIKAHIQQYIYIDNNDIPRCLDQPFIVYNSIIQNKYDNKLLNNYVKNIINVENSNIDDNIIIYHFPGDPGNKYSYKLNDMINFNKKIYAKYLNNVFKTNFLTEDILAVTPSNIYDEEKMKYLLQSTKINKFNINIIGLYKTDQKFTMMSKIMWLIEYLLSLPIDKNYIIVFTDAYDVFYLDNLQTIKNKFLNFNTNIVWSVEKWYSHQLIADKPFYDNLCDSSSKYKYINCGTFLGYKDDLINLLNELLNSLENQEFCSEIKRENCDLDDDQTVLSHYLCKNWEKHSIKLDYNCEIFYVATEDWNDIDHYIDDNMTVLETNKKPSIIHVPWKSKYEIVLEDLFYKKYHYLTNKIFTWNNEYIFFYDNYKMFAFGDGSYKYLNSNIIQADFGFKKHIITFDKEFKFFFSICIDNLEILFGNIKNILTIDESNDTAF
jgi:hypothetical protein